MSAPGLWTGAIDPPPEPEPRMTESNPPICPCCNKPVPPDKIEAFQRNMARFVADNPDAQDLRDAVRHFQENTDDRV